MSCDHTAQVPAPKGPSHKATELSRKRCPLAEGLAAASARELGKGLSERRAARPCSGEGLGACGRDGLEPQAVVGLLAKGVITGKDTVFSVAAEEGMEAEQVAEGREEETEAEKPLDGDMDVSKRRCAGRVKCTRDLKDFSAGKKTGKQLNFYIDYMLKYYF